MIIVKRIILFLIVAVIIIFAVQNSENITIELFNWSVTLPVSLVIISIYLLGMTTGGILFSIIKKLMESNDEVIKESRPQSPVQKSIDQENQSV